MRGKGNFMSKIVKSHGVTPTERNLAALCDGSFLRLWSYPNPIRDDGKELCDVLAVFDNHAFIFFDRENKQMDNPEKDPLINWRRWERDTIESQVRTAHGAERYLRSGRGVFLDGALTTPFPHKVDWRHLIVHKIVVAHGAKEACLKASQENVYGSLAISYGSGQCGTSFPFLVHLDKEKPVHVFDSHNVGIIFGELDTFWDFTTYLDAKVEAVRKFDVLSYCGEEDLLAHYFLNYDATSKRYRIGPREGEYNSVHIGEGEWSDFVKLPQYENRKRANEISYVWDDLIQKTCQNALDGTLGGNAKLLEGRSAIHEMAREPRLSRRALSENMINSMRKFPESGAPIMRKLSFMPSHYPGTGYVFLQLKAEGIEEAFSREKRQAMLDIACGAARNKFDYLTKVVGIAMAPPKLSRINSEDFVLLECADWPDEQRRYYDDANRDLKFLCSEFLVQHQRTIAEFPLK